MVTRSILVRLAGLALVCCCITTSYAGGENIQPDFPSEANQITELTIANGRSNPGNPATGAILLGLEARQQLVVTARVLDGRLVDYTRLVEYESKPVGVIAIDETGFVRPLANGTVYITAKAGLDMFCTIKLTVREINKSRQINFPNQIVPIFTKSGCNGGGCHGKSSGQNGFRLSLLGFEPKEDFEHLVIEGRGRRIFPAAPERSLLLLKAAAIVPHGGGRRLSKDSPAFELISRWIRQGMPYGKPNDPKVAQIQVLPDHRLMSQNQEQQLVVIATYSDGSTQDVTRLVQYESNEKDMVEVSKTGLVKVGEQPGLVAVMVRFQDQVATFRVTIPHGAPVNEELTVRNFIDEWVFQKLQTLELPPSDRCDDATFLRRASIDIAGRLPTASEAKNFLADPNPHKRGKWIDTLLDGPGYADYFANKWNAILRNRRRDAASMRGNFLFRNWIRDSLYQNKPYDRFMREIITASGEIGRSPAVTWYREVNKTEDQVQDAAQIFLGVRLQCARCHHHPFETWSQEDYYGFAAFFSRLGRKPGIQSGEEILFHKRGTAVAINPKTKLPAKPTGLGTESLNIAPDQDPRYVLADWMAAKDNPFFARMLVNRYWKHFFGRGLVEPEDDMRVTNPPTNPGLLDALASHFISSGYDLKDLIRTICQSQTYQLSSYPNRYNSKDRQNFSRYYARRLTAEVLLDAIDHVTDVQTIFPGQPRGTRAVQLPDNSYNTSSYFLKLFGRPNNASASESERTEDANLAQSLHLLNSQKIQEKVVSEEGRIARLAKDTNQSDEAKIRELYYWVFSRQPKDEELNIALNYVQKTRMALVDHETSQNKLQEAYQDTLWALLNTKEFLFNH